MLALLTAAHLGISEVCSNAYVSRQAGSSRADVLEIYGGDANASIIAAKQCFWPMGPIGQLYNYDLRKPQDRGAVLDLIGTYKPRLVIT